MGYRLESSAAASSEIRCGIYARCASSLESEKEIDRQVSMCRKYAGDHDLIVVEQYVLSDIGVAGNRVRGLGLQALMNAAMLQPSPFDCILVSELSRLGGNLALTAERLRHFDSRGVHIAFADRSESGTESLECLAALERLFAQLVGSPKIVGSPKPRIKHGRGNYE